jgi:peroxiredoxin
MTRRRDGTFVASIPCASESLRYQLLGVAKDGLPTAGTMADTFFLRRGRGIASIRAGGKPVDVVFDPRRLPRSRSDVVVRYSDPHGLSAAIFPLFLENTREEERTSRLFQAHLAAGGDADSFTWDRSAYLRTLERQLARERDGRRRPFLLLTCLRMGGARTDSTLALEALQAIPPDSPIWGLSPGGPAGPLWAAWSATKRSDLIRAYAERGSTTHLDRDTRAGFLSVAISEAERAGDKDRVGRYVTRMSEEFQGTEYHQITEKRLGSNRKIRPGQLAPDAALSALEDTSKVIRISDFRGKHLLLDFWAVWCGPCRAEMPNIHKAWDAFKDRGLAIVGVSFDRQRVDVVAYRRDKWAMPWIHTFVDQGFQSEVSAAYDVWGIPKAVLIGPDGTIVAEGDELRGEKLHGTLARVLGEPGAAATGSPSRSAP